MKKRFVLKKGKVYLLSKEERERCMTSSKKQLRKEYIRPLKSPQIVSVFFLEKKDNKKRIVQNYRYLNEWSIKNNYPLSLISDIVENISTKKEFIKLNLRWG